MRNITNRARSVNPVRRGWRTALKMAALVLAGHGVSACTSTVLFSELSDAPGMTYYLPKTMVTVEIAAWGYQDTKKTTEDIVELRIKDKGITPAEYADRRRSYTLRYEPSSSTNDRVCMGVNNEGLLTSVESANDDKTGDIIISIAKLAGRLVGPGAFAAARQRDVKKLTELRSIQFQLDPLDRTEWRQLNQAIRVAFPTVEDQYRFSVEDYQQLVPDATENDSCPVNAICYRTKVPVRFTLKKYSPDGRRGGAVISSQYASIVSRRKTRHINVTRALMVEKVTNLGFKQGVLETVRIKKPSEGLAVAQLPLTVLDAVMTSALSAPGKFFGNFSGLPPGEAAALVKQSAANAAEVKLLQDELETIRKGDLDLTETATKVFDMKCTPGVPDATK